MEGESVDPEVEPGGEHGAGVAGAYQERDVDEAVGGARGRLRPMRLMCWASLSASSDPARRPRSGSKRVPGPKRVRCGAAAMLALATATYRFDQE